MALRSTKRTRTVTVRPAQVLLAKPGGNPICQVTQGRADDVLGSRLLTKRRLCADRARTMVSLHGARILIPGEGSQSTTDRIAQQSIQSAPRRIGELPNGVHAHLGQTSLCNRADAPHQLYREVVEKLQLGSRIDDDRAHRAWQLAKPIFARCLVRATPIEMGNPTSSRTLVRMLSAISAGVPNRWTDPDTSAKASSIEIRSMSGVKSLTTSIALSPKS